MRHILAQLESLGFRTEILFHDAYISLPGTSAVIVDNETIPSITHSFSRASGEAGVTGRLVSVGAGNDADFAIRARNRVLHALRRANGILTRAV